MLLGARTLTTFRRRRSAVGNRLIPPGVLNHLFLDLLLKLLSLTAECIQPSENRLEFLRRQGHIPIILQDAITRPKRLRITNRNLIDLGGPMGTAA